MRFGHLLRELRKKRGIQQKNLASLAGISSTLLSNIEQGKKTPSQKTAFRLMQVLGLDDRAREPFLRALEEEIGSGRSTLKGTFVFGYELSIMLNKLRIDVPELANEMKRPAFTVRSWVDGSMLPSDVTLESEIIRVLKSRGANDLALQNLKIAHVRDILMRSLKLSYIREDKVQLLIPCITECIAKEKDLF